MEEGQRSLPAQPSVQPSLLVLANPDSPSYVETYGPERALAFHPDSQGRPYDVACYDHPFCGVAASDGGGLVWQADIQAGVSIQAVSVFGDMRVPLDPHFSGIVAELLDARGAVMWRSPLLGLGALAGAEGGHFEQHATVVVPGALCCCSRLRVSRPAAPPGEFLCLSSVRCFGGPAQSVLLLARHGQADHNVGNAYDPVCGPGLTPHGQADAEHLAQAVLEGLQVVPDLILVSPQRRALETAAIVRRCEERLANVPIEVLRTGYEHAWHAEGGAQIPPADMSRWPAGAATVIGADPLLVDVIQRSLSKGIPGAHPGSVAGQVLAHSESAQGARQRAKGIIWQLERRAQVRAQSGQPAERIILLIAHGGINHDILCCIDPTYSPFMLQHHQRNGTVRCAALPF